MERAKSYIARKDEFAKALMDCGALSVVAIMPDASITYTQLSGYITDVVRHGSSFLVKTSHMKGDLYLTLNLI